MGINGIRKLGTAHLEPQPKIHVQPYIKSKQIANKHARTNFRTQNKRMAGTGELHLLLCSENTSLTDKV